MRTYEMTKVLIQNGRTAGLADKLDVLYINNRLTDEQYTELISMLSVTEG